MRGDDSRHPARVKRTIRKALFACTLGVGWEGPGCGEEEHPLTHLHSIWICAHVLVVGLSWQIQQMCRAASCRQRRSPSLSVLHKILCFGAIVRPSEGEHICPGNRNRTQAIQTHTNASSLNTLGQLCRPASELSDSESQSNLTWKLRSYDSLRDSNFFKL